MIGGVIHSPQAMRFQRLWKEGGVIHHRQSRLIELPAMLASILSISAIA